jgi:hypothetical protein
MIFIHQIQDGKDPTETLKAYATFNAKITSMVCQTKKDEIIRQGLSKKNDVEQCLVNLKRQVSRPPVGDGEKDGEQDNNEMQTALELGLESDRGGVVIVGNSECMLMRVCGAVGDVKKEDESEGGDTQAHPQAAAS